MDDWKHFEEIDFADESILQYHIDTRDFHCSEDKEKTEHVFTIKPKYEKKFYYTPQEVKETILRLFNESGGNKSWRMLSLCGEGKRWTEGWQIKYIRIYRTEKGLIMANKDGHALSKDILQYKVNQEFLSAH